MKTPSCTARGIGIWEWASNDVDGEPDVVLGCAGDIPTLETVAAALLREHLPDLKVRVVNVVDLMRLQPESEHPHGLSDVEFDALFTRDRPIVFAYHGYPWLIHRLTYRRTNHGNLHVRGYKEEGTTTTPFDMVMLNDLDRFHLVMDVIDRVPGLVGRASRLRQEMDDRRLHARMDARARRGSPGRPRLGVAVRRPRELRPRRQRRLDEPQALGRRAGRVLGGGRGAGAGTRRGRRRRPPGGARRHTLPRSRRPRRRGRARAGRTRGARAHNGPALAAIAEARQALPAVPHVAVFDTAFPRHCRTRQAPTPSATLARGVGIRRYGFHGLSVAWAAERVAVPRLVVCHLGGGCSVTAVRDGRSVETSMGFSPLEGVPMATRSGTIDPEIVLHMIRHGLASAEEIEAALERESGLLGLSGLSARVEELEASDEPEAGLALEVFAYRVACAVAASAVALDGLDALVFTAGVGERSPGVRSAVCGRLGSSWTRPPTRPPDGDAEVAKDPLPAWPSCTPERTSWPRARAEDSGTAPAAQGGGALGRASAEAALAHHEHVALSVVYDSRADRAEHDPLGEVLLARADDDQVRAALLRVLDQGLADIGCVELDGLRLDALALEVRNGVAQLAAPLLDLVLVDRAHGAAHRREDMHR